MKYLQSDKQKLRQTSGFRKRCSFCFPGDEGTMRETSSSSSDSWSRTMIMISRIMVMIMISRIMIMISRSQALAKVPPGVGDRGGVKAGEVWTANACATLRPAEEIFSGSLAISASSQKKWLRWQAFCYSLERVTLVNYFLSSGAEISQPEAKWW